MEENIKMNKSEYDKIIEIFDDLEEKSKLTISKDSKLLEKLNQSMKIAGDELRKYSTTPTYGEAKEGFEAEYNRYVKIVRFIQQAKNCIFMPF